jgi:BirA family biotin operon repressor/biotin-[acetyl-CoA-carboxylase] ligase
MNRLSETLFLDAVDSTNSYALLNFDAFGDGTLIVARSQSAGRGRKGRSWSSPAGANVYASLILKGFKFLPAQASWIGSLAALEALRQEAPRLNLKVKWPNDVICGEAKIAGVLCETKAGKNGGIVIGIGVNLNMGAEDLAALGRPACSVLSETGRHVESVETFAIMLGEEAMRLYQEAKNSGIKTLHTLWSAETGLAGSRVEALLDDGSVFCGTVETLRIDGSLSIRRDNGALAHVSAGEISLRQAQPQGFSA